MCSKSARRLSVNVNTTLSEEQITDLARPLVGILETFYQDPKNEEEFERWLLSVEKEKEIGS